MLREYLCEDYRPDEGMYVPLVCTAMASVARRCVIPLPDWPGYDNRARINVPSATGENWKLSAVSGQSRNFLDYFRSSGWRILCCGKTLSIRMGLRISARRLFAVRLGYSEKQVVRTLHTSKSMPVYMKYFSERITLSFPGGRPRL